MTPPGAGEPGPIRRRPFARPPVLCGHRGCGAGTVEGNRENTLASFRAAAAAGAEWVEVDARRTTDGVLVARHDGTVEDGRFVAELSAAETDALGLLRIEALLDELPRGVGLDVEIKSAVEDALRDPWDTTAGLVAAAVRRRAGERPLLCTSFDAAAVVALRDLLPGVPLGLLTWGRFPLEMAVAAAARLRADAVMAHVGSFTSAPGVGGGLERDAARIVHVAHESGLQVGAWCPRPEQVDELLAVGVDCLVVDDLPAALRMRPDPAGRVP
jgi:glycerophosphoryl diester phosphodiesterase